MNTHNAEIRFVGNSSSKYRDKIQLLQSFKYNAATDYFKSEVIPRGYKTDNASVPDYLAWFISPNDKRIREASWFHDYVWEHKYKFADQYGITLEELRKKSNKEMQQKCIFEGLSKYKAYLVYFVLQYSPQAKKVWREGLYF